MRNPELAARVVEAMVAKTALPVTVKMRLGWDSDSRNAVSFAREVCGAGAAAVCVHGRTREQYYSGRADWRAIGEVKTAVGIAVYGSGDVFSGFDAVRMLRETGCDAVMAARGARGNPWIFRDARMLQGGADAEEVRRAAPSIRARADMLLRQAALTCEAKGEYIAVREMRSVAGWYFKRCQGVHTLRTAINRAESLEALHREIEQFARQKGAAQPESPL
jgi:nifR3 family TIM-barrel protein